MLKKSLLLGLLLSFQTLNAFTLFETDHGNYLKINPNFHNEGKTDWIAVYSKGSSTDWKNVIKWKWATDTWDKDLYLIPTLKNGDYEVRYFKNNSYKIADSYALHIDHDKPKVFRAQHIYKNGYAMVFINERDIDQGEKDWIAYYKKGASTAWENVLKWHWVKDLRCLTPDECHNTVPPEDLAPGEYELRYFKNNSFTIYGEPLNINIKKVPSTLESIYLNFNDKSHLRIVFNGLGKFLQPNPKDWIGLYPVQSTNAWENVVQWVWAKDIKLVAGKFNMAYYMMKNIKPGTYEIRYFLNNSFKTYVRSKPFRVE